jgi:DNA modification methylase
MELQTKKVSDLIPYINNSRTHSDEQINQIISSIKEFGFTNPILLEEENGIIAGHGRLIAVRKMGWSEVPCVTIKGLTKTQIKALNIADNQIALNAGWDLDKLKLEVKGLDEEDFNLDILGFNKNQIDDFLFEEVIGLTDEDSVPEIKEDPKSKLGDIFILGTHRIMCGDSTSEDAVNKLTKNNKVDILFTDPPYGINFVPQRKTHEKILNDSLNDKEFDSFLNSMLSCALKSMKPNTYAFIWTGWSRIGAFEKAITNFFKIQALHIWVKNNFGIGYYSRPKHEPFYLCLNGKPIYPSKAPADVWEENKVHKTIHSCEKPVELIINILDTYHKNSLVLDLFGGSGSTLIACEKTNRINHTMELDPKYCDVIIQRWQQYTGKEAIHEQSGKRYNEL